VIPRRTDIYDGSPYPKARRAASQEGYAIGSNFWDALKAPPRPRATFIKFGGEMAYFRQCRAALA
jgi:hypothetical protein